MPKTIEQPDLQITIHKTDKCKTLSNKGSIITFNIGGDPNNEIYIRIVSNTGGGFFSAEWIKLEDIMTILTKLSPNTAINSIYLARLFTGKSANSSGFLLAALKHLGLLEPMNGKSKRSHKLVDPEGFIEKMNSLASSKRASTSKRKTVRKKTAAKAS